MAATLKLLQAIGSPKKGRRSINSNMLFNYQYQFFTDHIWLDNGQWTSPSPLQLWQYFGLSKGYSLAKCPSPSQL